MPLSMLPTAPVVSLIPFVQLSFLRGMLGGAAMS